MFGSIARGDASPDSDVDLTVDFAPGAEMSLLDLARIKADLKEVPGWSVDLGERSTMTPRVAAAAERELVRVF